MNEIHNISSNNTSLNTNHLQNLIFIFGIILTSIFCLIGSLGNVIAMMVTMRMMMQRHLHPLFAIFSALILSDTLMLILCLVINILCVGYPYTKIQFTIPLYINHGPIIIVLWPMLLAFQMSSTYLTVLVSYERFVAVCKPFHSNRCSFKRVCRWIISINVLSIFYNSPRWWEYQVNKEVFTKDDLKTIPITYLCTLDQIESIDFNDTQIINNVALAVNMICNITIKTYDKSNLGSHFVYRYGYCAALYAVVMFLIPVVLITYWNVALVMRIRSSRIQWNQMSRTQRKEVKMTTLPLTIVILFYILGLPAVLINLCDSLTASINTDMPIIGDKGWQAMLTISNFLVIINSSINFIIYCFAGRKFRETMLLMFCYSCTSSHHRRNIHGTIAVSNCNYDLSAANHDEGQASRRSSSNINQIS